MSKLGLHVTIGRRDGFGNALLRCSVANSPIAVLQAVDVDLWPDVSRYSPATRLIFRTKLDSTGREIGDGPQAMYTGDPAVEADVWMTKILPRWRQNRAHYYAPINEQDGGPVSDMDWLNAFLLRCLTIAQDNGFKLALPNFSTGNPRDDSLITRLVYLLFEHRVPALAARLNGEIEKSRAKTTAIIPGSAEDRWQRLIPALRALRDTGGVLTLHQYGLHYGALMASAPYLALRHRRDAAFLRASDALPRIVINEAGPGVGGIEPDIPRWLSDLSAYDAELMRDQYVIGAAVYQLGGAENIVAGLSNLAGYIASTPTPELPPEPEPQPASLTLKIEPRPASYEVIYSLDSDQATITVPANSRVTEVE